MTVDLRADRVAFRFSGPDAHRLVNDVVTGPVPAGDDEVARHWALLSPQGKIMAEGLAGWAEGALWLDVHHAVAEDFHRAMRRYRLRAKVEIEALGATHRVGYAEENSGENSGGKPPDAVVHAARLGPLALGWRVIAPLPVDWRPSDLAYQEARIAAGIAHQGNDFPANELFAHDIGMDILGGIDFAKGCYVGQEVVSRMKHRGTARRRPVIVSGLEGPVPAGTALTIGDRPTGTIGQSVNGRAIAILRLDRIADPAEARVDGGRVELRLPAWADYSFGAKPVPESR